jgi:hypothetical protein
MNISVSEVCKITKGKLYFNSVYAETGEIFSTLSMSIIRK